MAARMMEIECYGGPADGIVLNIPADSVSWLVPTPVMTPSQFIALESGGTAAPGEMVEHLYVMTERFGKHTAARVFTYSGPKRR